MKKVTGFESQYDTALQLPDGSILGAGGMISAHARKTDAGQVGASCQSVKLRLGPTKLCPLLVDIVSPPLGTGVACSAASAPYNQDNGFGSQWRVIQEQWGTGAKARKIRPTSESHNVAPVPSE